MEFYFISEGHLLEHVPCLFQLLPPFSPDPPLGVTAEQDLLPALAVTIGKQGGHAGFHPHSRGIHSQFPMNDCTTTTITPHAADVL